MAATVLDGNSYNISVPIVHRFRGQTCTPSKTRSQLSCCKKTRRVVFHPVLLFKYRLWAKGRSFRDHCSGLKIVFTTRAVSAILYTGRQDDAVKEGDHEEGQTHHRVQVAQIGKGYDEGDDDDDGKRSIPRIGKGMTLG